MGAKGARSALPENLYLNDIVKMLRTEIYFEISIAGDAKDELLFLKERHLPLYPAEDMFTEGEPISLVHAVLLTEDTPVKLLLASGIMFLPSKFVTGVDVPPVLLPPVLLPEGVGVPPPVGLPGVSLSGAGVTSLSVSPSGVSAGSSEGVTVPAVAVAPAVSPGVTVVSAPGTGFFAQAHKRAASNNIAVKTLILFIFSP